MNFKETIQKLSTESDNPLATECMNCMLNDTVFFNARFKQNKEKLISLYAFRLKNAKSESSTWKEGELDSWERAVEKLRITNCDELRLSSVTSDYKSYILFWNVETKVLVALFHLPTKYSISQYQTFVDGSRESSSIRYEKGLRQ